MWISRDCNASCTLQETRLEAYRDAGTDVKCPMVLDAWIQTIKTSQSGYIVLHLGLREFFPASPRQLHSWLYRTIIGEPGRNEDDLSHGPLVSGSLEAFVVAEMSDVSAPGELRWLGSLWRVYPGWSTLVAATRRCYWVTFSSVLPSPAGTRYTRVASLPISDSTS